MDKRLEFFFDFGSPTSYLAYTQLPKLAADCGATWSGGRCCWGAYSRPPAMPAR